jgi:DNA-binding NarL/FixJ family response regulator
MIRVATVDRHPAVLAGVQAILRDQPDLVPVGAAIDRYQLWPLLHRTRPDVVLLDHPPGNHGLELCLRITVRPAAPRVVLFAHQPPGDRPGDAGRAHAILDKATPLRQLLEAIRAVTADDGSREPEGWCRTRGDVSRRRHCRRRPRSG